MSNPVLIYELLTNLRMARAFVLQFVYVGLLGFVVWMAWPAEQKIDMTNPQAAARLINLLFAGQFLVASLIVPGFAAGSLTGEKERQTYESLLASPLPPRSIVAGKLLASLVPVALLIFSSLPVVVLCIPLGGVSFYEVLAAYLALLVLVSTFAMVSLACSSRFQRTISSLAVSYLLILPPAIVVALLWLSAGAAAAGFRITMAVLVLPIACLALFITLFRRTCRQLLYPRDLGSEGREVIDQEQEARQAVGMIIQRDEFPDRLFAPPKRTDLLEDGDNAVYDKEMRSELFSQGTLMLRLVIQISIFAALPVMAFCLYFYPVLAPWYVCYVLLFNMLVGPVFSAGAITSERERETLDLLLCTLLSGRQILSGKLLANLRVSTVLTLLITWPIPLAWLLVPEYPRNWPTLLGYLALVLVACLTTSMIALACSTVYRRTSVSMTMSYIVIVILFVAPLAARTLGESFAPAAPLAGWLNRAVLVSPFATALDLPLELPAHEGSRFRPHGWHNFGGCVLFYVLLNGMLFAAMVRAVGHRWFLAEQIDLARGK